MTKTEATNLNKELNTAINSILDKYNLKITRSSLSFGEREVKLHVIMEHLNEDGSHKSDDYTERMLKHELTMNGIKNIPSTIVGSKIMSIFSGEYFIITGYNSRAQKYPIEAQRIKTGQIYKMTGKNIKFV